MVDIITQGECDPSIRCARTTLPYTTFQERSPVHNHETYILEAGIWRMCCQSYISYITFQEDPRVHKHQTYIRRQVHTVCAVNYVCRIRFQEVSPVHVDQTYLSEARFQRMCCQPHPCKILLELYLHPRSFGFSSLQICLFQKPLRTGQNPKRGL